MRISLVSDLLPAEFSDTELPVSAFAHGLAARGHDVEWVHRSSRSEGGVSEAVVVRAERSASPLREIRLPPAPGGRLRRAWKDNPPDAVFLAGRGMLGRTALNLAKRRGIPICLWCPLNFDDLASRIVPRWTAPLLRGYLRRFHRRANATTVPTRALAADLAACGIDNVRLLRHGVDTSLFNPRHRDTCLRTAWATGDDGLAVLHVGPIAPGSNIELAIDAFRKAQACAPRARCIWIGDGPDRAALAAANPDFIFSGALHGEMLARHYASADLLLFPSCVEPFGGVVLEAMASGLAIVAFNRGAAREHLLDGISGMRVPLGDSRGFVGAAYALCVDTALRNTLRENARIAVSGCSRGAILAQLESLLRCLACSSSVRTVHHAVRI